MRFSQVKSVAIVAVAALLLGGCGLNPFGSGEGGLSIFAKIGKAMQKPSAINDEQNSKASAEAAVSEAQGAAKRLAKGTASAAEIWRDTSALESISAGKYRYWEHVTNKPSEEDPDKVQTGRGEVVFLYSEPLDSVQQIVSANIIGIESFHFIGREVKTWKQEIDSLDLTVAFSSTGIDSIKPGLTTAWGKNISATIEQGQGDTAYFALDSLDDVNHIQYGEGHFLDAHTGRDNTGDPYPFNFEIQVIHKNLLDPSRPYLRYQDNEGIVTFTIPWGRNATDSLHFMIHFFPNYERSGTITDDNGVVRVRFVHNEKTGVGSVLYYNDKGEEIAAE